MNSVYSKLKDKVPITSQSDVVYSIPCSECEKIYIGQTSRQLSQRIISHKSDCRLHPERCALAEHVNKFDHKMKYEEVKILNTQRNLTKRLFLEMTCIAQTENCINKKTDISHLSEIYSYLLFLDKNITNLRTYTPDLTI